MIKYLLLFSFLLSSCVSGKDNEPPDASPLYATPTSDLEEKGPEKVLVSWGPEGSYVGVEEYGIGCGWSGEIGDWLHIYDLDTRHPFMWYNSAEMYCTRLQEFEDGWYIQCQQRVITWFVGPFWNYLDFFVLKKANDLGHKGLLYWTKDFVELDVWCIDTVRITDERPTYEWR